MNVVSAAQMREIEQRAIQEYGIPSILLMENAAMAVVREIRQHFAELQQTESGRKAVVLVGKGNNGGDGLAVARHLSQLDMQVTVFLFAAPEEFQGDAALNLQLIQGTTCKLFLVEGEKQRRLTRLALNQTDVVVDAIYGTGLRGALPSLVEDCIQDVNQVPAWVVAVDIPSGVEADTGNVYNVAVQADLTVTFGLPKLGHFLDQGAEHCGKLIVDTISIPPKYLEDEMLTTSVLTSREIRELLPKRRVHGHKGTHGRGILAAGSPGMTGAAILAGKGALRSGIGLIQIVTPGSAAAIIAAGLTEATVWPIEQDNPWQAGAWSVIEERCQGAQALAMGPGMGQHLEALELIEMVLHQITLPLVMDADALNLIAKAPQLLQGRQRKGPLILTPHPGEMARLCQMSIAEVQTNRLELAVSKAVEWEVVVVLKGAVTIVAAPDGRVFLNPTGNPGLGTGGTGDVLTGSILAWLAQGVPPVEAACLGVYLHGLAGDRLAQEVGLSGFTASEVADALPKVRYRLELHQA